MRNLAFIFVALCFCVYYFWPVENQPQPLRYAAAQAPLTKSQAPSTITRAAPRLEKPSTPPPSGTNPTVASTSPPTAQVVSSERKAHGKPALHYKLEHGLIIVQGDQVVGAPTKPDVSASGMVELSPVGLWPNGVIPYHIQPNVPNPQRVLQAIAMFEGTAVRLVPYNGEEDALVFESGEQNCYSYVGHVGGKQPLWISPGCGPTEIAHEILHACGFIHEQNRSDRDDVLNMHYENIDEQFQINFEKMPTEYMKVSGLGEFDFQSLMIYPPWMFAKNGQSTMEPRQNDKFIQPSTNLSPGDIARLNRAYAPNRGEK